MVWVAHMVSAIVVFCLGGIVHNRTEVPLILTP